MFRKVAFIFVLLCALAGAVRAYDFGPSVVISARDQKLAVIDAGKVKAKYDISTSKFGIGDDYGSYKTPLGTMWVCNKIGGDLPAGAVIRNRNATGEVIPPNAPGRDPIVSRVIWLSGLDPSNKNAYQRCIYIHGTTEEKSLGKPVSYGCIRMRSKDIIALYGLVQVGTHVTITDKALKTLLPAKHMHFSLLRFW
jgi:lipoprotein-anchoring transpeptidase ErfK/SrfK